jgi:hypothetical protein
VPLVLLLFLLANDKYCLDDENALERAAVFDRYSALHCAALRVGCSFVLIATAQC